MELKKNHFVQKMLDYVLKLPEFEQETEPTRSTKRKLKSNEEADCPICTKSVLIKKMNEHIDSGCKLFLKVELEYQKKGSVPYDLYKTPQLKQMLLKEGLFTNGDRKMLIKRHSYYIELFNSNCDAKCPKSVQELLKMVQEWEKSTSGTKMTFGKTKEEDLIIVNSHMKSYGNEFDQLIANVKAKRLKTESRAVKEEPVFIIDSDDEITAESVDISATIDQGDENVAEEEGCIELEESRIHEITSVVSNFIEKQNTKAPENRDNEYVKEQISNVKSSVKSSNLLESTDDQKNVLEMPKERYKRLLRNVNGPNVTKQTDKEYAIDSDFDEIPLRW